MGQKHISSSSKKMLHFQHPRVYAYLINENPYHRFYLKAFKVCLIIFIILHQIPILCGNKLLFI